MHKSVVAQLFVVGVLALAAPILGAAESSAGAGPVDVVQAWNEALNRHDSDAVMALMASGASIQVDREPQQPEQLRGWIEQLIREDVHVDLLGPARVNPASVVRYSSGLTIAW